MSRALARLPEATAAPPLVRAGAGLVLVPQAREAEAVPRPAEALDLGGLTRTFTPRNRERFVETFGPLLPARVAAEARGAAARSIWRPGFLAMTWKPELQARVLFPRLEGRADRDSSRGSLTRPARSP